MADQINPWALLAASEVNKLRQIIEDLERQVTLHKEIADAREFEVRQAEARVADLTMEADKHVEEITHLRNEATRQDMHIAEILSKSGNQYKCGFADGCYQFQHEMQQAGYADAANAISSELIESYAKAQADQSVSLDRAYSNIRSFETEDDELAQHLLDAEKALRKAMSHIQRSDGGMTHNG